MKQARRQPYWIGMLGIMILLLASACGNSGKEAGSNGAEVSPAPSESTAADSSKDPVGSDAGTKSFVGENGTVQVPVSPQRIVALAPNYAGYLLALGVTPVGIPAFTLGNPYLTDKLDGVVNLGESAPTEPSIEQVLALKPDLIVAIDVLKNKEQLEKIAPVVTFESTKNNRELLLALGELTGRKDRAEAWLKDWDAKIAGLKPQIEAAVGEKTISVMYPSAKGIYMFREGYGRGTEILYGDFGLRMPDKEAQSFEEGKGFSMVGLESLPEMAGDIVFSAPWLGDAAGADTVYDSEIWKGLPAVKEGRAYAVDYNIFTFSDPYSWEGQLDIITDKLLAK